MTKPETRRWAKQQRAALDLHAIGTQMGRALLQLPVWQQADTVLAFASLPDEPDTHFILQSTLAAGKRLLLPRVVNKTAMEWAEIPVLSALAAGAYGIAEPPGTLPAADLTALGRTLALVPCLAADVHGTRLGRGGGYYDRFLAHYKGDKLLLCPAALVLPALEREEWDIAFSPAEILTEKGTLT